MFVSKTNKAPWKLARFLRVYSWPWKMAAIKPPMNWSNKIQFNRKYFCSFFRLLTMVWKALTRKTAGSLMTEIHDRHKTARNCENHDALYGERTFSLCSEDSPLDAGVWFSRTASNTLLPGSDDSKSSQICLIWVRLSCSLPGIVANVWM